MAMDNAREKKGSSKMEKLIKYACQLINTVTSRLICGNGRATVVSHPSAVRCDELFRPPNKRCYMGMMNSDHGVVGHKEDQKENFSTPCIVRENQ